jgi:GTP-binding protein
VLTKADDVKTADHGAALQAAAAEAGKHTAALAQVLLTSALTGGGIPELRAHLASLAQ